MKQVLGIRVKTFLVILILDVLNRMRVYITLLQYQNSL
jgi:hypothetical protein